MGQAQPVFSIVIPTYGRPGQLAACLRAVARLDYPRDAFEVLVVDDGSDVSPSHVITAMDNRLNIQLLTQSKLGPAAARNYGARHAKGEFLAFVDDDCAPASDWLSRLASRFVQSPDRAIGGRTINAIPNNLYASASQMLIDYLYTYYNANPEQARFVTSNNLALSRDRFRSSGSFDSSFPRAAGEDREICDRWRVLGFRILYAPEVIVYHAHNLTLGSYWKQHFNYGRGAFQFHQIRARFKREPLRVEGFVFYFNLLRFPLTPKVNLRSLPVALLFIASQIANSTGFFWEGGRAALHRLRKQLS